MKLLEPPKPVPEATRSEPLPRSRSIALADLPMKLVTEFDKIKLHIEVDRALVETATEACGIKVTDDEVNQYLRHLQVQSKTDQIPFAVFLQGMKLMPLFSQFYEATRQQLALVKLSGQANEPTDEELQDAYRLAQAGRVGRRRLAFPDKAKALEAARDMRLNPKPFEENAQNNWVADWQGSSSLIPTVPPQRAEEAIAKLQEGEVSDVIPEGDQFAIYQRLSTFAIVLQHGDQLLDGLFGIRRSSDIVRLRASLWMVGIPLATWLCQTDDARLQAVATNHASCRKRGPGHRRATGVG